jgi:soluble P-type ATPase
LLKIDIPGYRLLRLHHLVLDYNGTLAQNGILLAGVAPRLEQLSVSLRLHVVTADTYGQAKANLATLPCEVVILPAENHTQGKLAYVENLGSDQVVAIGNGRNDRLMLAAVALGIAVMQEEGAAIDALSAADVVMSDIRSALDGLIFPKGLIATLRS